MVLPWNHAISTVIIQVRLSFNITLIFQVTELEYELNCNKYNRWINLLLRRKKFIVLRKHTVPFKTTNSAYLNLSQKKHYIYFFWRSHRTLYQQDSFTTLPTHYRVSSKQWQLSRNTDKTSKRLRYKHTLLHLQILHFSNFWKLSESTENNKSLT